MKEIDPIISIIVPTKNRYKYLMVLIKLIESFLDRRIELVIQDNSDDNSEILDFLSHKQLISTKYFYDKSKLTMSGNADLSIKNSKGKYLCLIGDDDGVCRNIADCAEWMNENKIEALRSLEVQFCWNDSGNNITSTASMYYDRIKSSYKYFNPLIELEKLLKQGIPGFGKIPKLYHGIVERSVVEKIYTIGNTCFPGGSPDISIGIALCFYVNKYAMINIPVVLPGMSKMVGGGVNNKVLKLDEVPFISEQIVKNWETNIPPIWATELVWPESAVKSLRYVRKEDFLKIVNFNKVLSRFVIFHKGYFKLAFSYSQSKLKFLATMFFMFWRISIRFLLNKKILGPITGKINGRFTVKKNLKDIQSAENYLNDMGFLIPFKELKNNVVR